MLTIFERALLAHLIGDWLLQNDWIATNKASLRHPAAWVHAAIHTVLLGIALGWTGGIVLGLIHMLIDTRVPLRWWERLFKQTDVGPAGFLTTVWADQALHLTVIGAWILLVR